MNPGDIYTKDGDTAVLTWPCNDVRMAAIRFENGNATDDSFTQEELQGWQKKGNVLS